MSENGCKYCNPVGFGRPVKQVVIVNGYMEIVSKEARQTTKMFSTRSGSQIKFCPFCGRQIERSRE